MRIHTIFIALFSLSFSAACSTEDLPQRTTPGSQSGDQQQSPHGSDSETYLTFIEAREKVSVAFDLDTLNFRTNGLRAGLADHVTYKNIAVSMFLPSDADYLELMRCPNNSIVRGNFDSLLDLELGANSGIDEATLMAENDFWKVATESGCLLSSSDFSGSLFYDNSAPAGSFRYLARACVAPNRLSDAEGFTNRNCSRVVTLSNEVELPHSRSEAARKAANLAHQTQAKSSGLGRHIFDLTIRLNNALFTCQERETARLVAVKQKNAIATLVDAGVSLGGKYLEELNLQAKETDSLSIGSAITALFTSQSDFKKSCTEAEEIKQNAATAAQELKALGELYKSQQARAEALAQKDDGTEEPQQ